MAYSPPNGLRASQLREQVRSSVHDDVAFDLGGGRMPQSEAHLTFHSPPSGGNESLSQDTFTDTRGAYLFGQIAAATYLIKSELQVTIP